MPMSPSRVHLQRLQKFKTEVEYRLRLADDSPAQHTEEFEKYTSFWSTQLRAANTAILIARTDCIIYDGEMVF